MWHVIRTQVGQEEKIKDLCIKILKKEAYSAVFVPKYERKRRYYGSWHLEEWILFPECVFLDADDSICLHQELKNIPGLSETIETLDNFVPISKNEVDFLKIFLGSEYVIKMSEGHIVGNDVIVTSGPMMNFDGKIKKIDRHKRIAVIEASLFGRAVDMKVGLEIIYKVASA